MSVTNIDILPVDAQNKRLHRRFIRFPHTLYAENNNWVPFFNIDMRSFLTRKHPYYQNYPAQFFIAQRNGTVVGTLSVSYNHNYIESHNINTAHFFFYDIVDDIDVSRALFEQGEKWARERGATHIMGPLLSGLGSGSGLLIEGFDYPAMMTMMRYNFPYYVDHLTELGFKKYADLNSYCIEGVEQMTLDPRVERLINVVKKRGRFQIREPKGKREFRRMGEELFSNFLNKLMGDYPENYPVPANEREQMIKDINLIVRPDKLIFYLTYDGQPAGFGMGFPDITRAIQKCKGKINPISIMRLLYSIKHTKRFTCNGIGILPQYQGRGGNVLLYMTTYNAILHHNPDYLEFTQIGEKTESINTEMQMFLKKKNKVHRIMVKKM